ncbi:MAG: hypothetical protein QOI51_1915 [Nocardioidaceae bacterium]|nr:hypothetical protein [Nocardioidaceae bacterium]
MRHNALVSYQALEIRAHDLGSALRRSPAALAATLAGCLSLIWAALPPVGSDLAAQVAHAEFFGRSGWLPIDMRWFGGTDVFSYSLLSPPLMAVLGVTLFGILTTVAASGLLGLLLEKCAVPHPRAAAIVGAGCFAANLMVGRLTFALGVGVGLATLLGLWLEGRWRLPLLVLGTVLTWAASPLAALFLAMVGVALVARRRVAVGSALVMTGGLVLLASAGLGQSGVMPMAADDLARGVLACIVVAVVTRYHLVRIVAALSGLSLIFAYFVATPVGVNAVRFPAIFAVPVALATSRMRWRALIPVLAVTFLLIPPMTLGDAIVGQPANQAQFFTQLNHQLATRHLTGRVEVVPTADRWESVYVAGHVPLARGWMTQVDRARNELFFDPALMTAANYEKWLWRNGVQYVALSDAPPAAAGATEEALIQQGLPYLSVAWVGRDWTLYAVQNPTTTVSGADIVSQNGSAVTFRTSAPGEVTIRVEWSRWLTLNGPGAACLTPLKWWTQVQVHRPGTYVLSSSLLPGNAAAQCQPR